MLVYFLVVQHVILQFKICMQIEKMLLSDWENYAELHILSTLETVCCANL